MFHFNSDNGSDGSSGSDGGSDDALDCMDECGAKLQEACAIADCKKQNASIICPIACRMHIVIIIIVSTLLRRKGLDNKSNFLLIGHIFICILAGGCVDFKPKEQCDEIKAKGTCGNWWPKKNCKATCGYCGKYRILSWKAK